MPEEPKAGYIDLTKEYNSEEIDHEQEDAEPDPQEQHLKKPRYKIEGKTPHQQVEARPEEDEWMWNESKGTLTRFHINFRQLSFKPTDVENCPIDYNRLQAHRRTTMYFEDGRIEEFVDNWNPGTTRSNINFKDGKVARKFN